MIETLQIEHLRGIQFGWLEITARLTVLVGRNGCGKSTILDALHLAAHPRPSVPLSAIAQGNGHRLIRHGSDHARVWLRSSDRSVQIKYAMWGQFIAKADHRAPWGAIVRWPMPVADSDDHLVALYARAVALGGRETIEAAFRAAIPDCVGLAVLLDDEGRPMLCALVAGSSFDMPITDCGLGLGLRSLAEMSLRLASAGDDALVLLDGPDAHAHRDVLRPLAAGVRSAVARGVHVVLTTQREDTIRSICDIFADAPDDFAVVRIVTGADGMMKAHRTPGAEVIVLCREGISMA